MAVKTKAELKDLFRTGMVITEENLRDLIDTFLATLDGNTPDAMGNVNTTMKVIPKIRADVSWTEYPEGVSEFHTAFLKSDYTDYIAEYPSLAQLEDGDIAVRTFIDLERGIAYQYVDNIKDGVFSANYVRTGNVDGTWGELTTGTFNEEIVNSIPKVDGSPYFSLDEDKNLVLETEALANSLVDGDSLTVNENGKLVANGIEGPQGPPGADGKDGVDGQPGPKGETGPRGYSGSIRLIKTVTGTSKDNAEGNLPSTANVGDAVWIDTPDFKAIYVWTDDLTVIAEPGWFIGPNLLV